MTRKRRGLTEDEKRLWAAVKQTATPLRPEPVGAESRETAQPPMPEAKEVAGPAMTPRAAAPKTQPKAAPAVLDRRTLSRLSRGITSVDARIDLHGLTQSLAHRRLLRFLEEAQAHGARVVLVITGKGKPGEPAEYGFAERGVLRRAVPQWLRSADFQPTVSGFAEAGRRHGGSGAVYVRIRRRRD
jgi:DNA-nicking Smr family endonuclease